jgi:PPK2 family polyphosphate:nucleotide phosphotransferase
MLEKISTRGNSTKDKDQLKLENEKLIKKIENLQRVLYAESKQSLLVIFQGVDASGKDGAMNGIFGGINLLGCSVFSFKKPTEEEFAHDFLWRIHKVVPAKGMIHVFNRSHYEDILVPTVEGYYTKEIIERRYEHINRFEELLHDAGTKILKFYLHISKEEQLERLTERMENPEKFWKHNDGDWDSREKWDLYMKAYETIFEKCNTIPWHIIPSDSNTFKINAIAKIVLASLEEMKLHLPGLVTSRKA